MIDTLQTVLADLSGVTVVWANQDAPRPARPYLTIAIISVVAHGSDENTNVDDNGKQTTIGVREASVTISCFEAEDEPDPRRAAGRLSVLRDTLRTPGARDALFAGGLSVLGDQTVLNVPTVRGTKWQPQATLEMNIAFGTNVKTDMAWIETVMGEAGIDAYGRTHTETYQAEVNHG